MKHIMFILPTLPTGGVGVYLKKLLVELYKEDCMLSILLDVAGHDSNNVEVMEIAELTKENIFFDFKCSNIANIVKGKEVTNLVLVNSSKAYTKLQEIKSHCPDIQICDILFSEAHLGENLQYKDYIDYTFVEYTALAEIAKSKRESGQEKIITAVSSINNQRYLEGYDGNIDWIYDRYDIPQGHNIIFYAGRLSWEKNVFEILRIAEWEPNITFVLAGEGIEKRLLQCVTLFQNLNNIKIIGHIKDIRPFYKVAIALILTSFDEGIPNVILEALSLECPVISVDVGGIPEIIKHKKLGFIVKKHVLIEYIRAIDTLDNPDNLEQIKKNIREYNLGNAERFQTMVDKYRKVLL